MPDDVLAKATEALKVWLEKEFCDSWRGCGPMCYRDKESWTLCPIKLVLCNATKLTALVLKAVEVEEMVHLLWLARGEYESICEQCMDRSIRWPECSEECREGRIITRIKAVLEQAGEEYR